MDSRKPVHSIVLDAGPLLLNQPSISTLIAKSEQLYTIPAVISEIRDPVARARLETTVLPFLTVRTPSQTSLTTVSEFAKKTGDFAVLSKPDLQVLALAYELECERNHGDWRLRSTPGQKKLNGSPPKLDKEQTAETPESANGDIGKEAGLQESPGVIRTPADTTGNSKHIVLTPEGVPNQNPPTRSSPKLDEEQTESTDHASDIAQGITSEISQDVSQGLTQTTNQVEPKLPIQEGGDVVQSDTIPVQTAVEDGLVDSISVLGLDSEAADPESKSDSDDSDGWITPSNLARHRQKENSKKTEAENQESQQTTLQVATLTGDFALQNTLLLMNLNLISPSITRISRLKSHILRCHACFATSKEMNRQFCARCGLPTMTRVSCTTSANGEFKLHLKQNMQWNSRGDRYSVPKPVHGSSNGKIGRGGRSRGGKGGWGRELLLSEDQKEYSRAVTAQGKRREKDLMDEDYLPSILTGQRSNGNGNVKVGAGRNVNSRKR